MAIFTTTKAVVEETLPEVGEIMGTTEASDQILYEAAEDFYKINAGLYISDILIEQAVTEGAAEPEALMEGTIKDFFKRIVEALKKFWAKIKAWFKGVVENIKVLFMSGEKFIKEYENKLKEKKDKGFKYSAFKYDMGAFDSIYNKVKNKCESEIGIPTTIDAKATKEDAIDKFGVVASKDSTEYVEIICKSGSSTASSIAELKKVALKAAHSNSDEALDWIDFNGNSMTEMISTVKGYKQALSDINKSQIETDAAFSNTIKGFNSLEKSIKDNSDLTSVIGKVSTNIKSALSIVQNMNSLKVSLIREQYSVYLSILKRFAVYRNKTATKESVETVEGSLLESAMSLL